MNIEIEIQISSVFWSPPPTPPPFELSEDDAIRLARFRRITVEEVEAMGRDEIRQLEREYIEWLDKRLTGYVDRFLALEEEEEPKISKFYSIPGYCGSKDPQNRIRKNLHNLMFFYSTFPIMM
ncbi:unnamed protein product [Caenorhabditis brenneri]